MKTSYVLSIAFIAAAVTSCAPSQEKFDMIQTALEGSPAARAEAISGCTSKVWSAQSIKGASLVMNVPKPKAQKLACSRMVAAVASGRLTYQDITPLYRGIMTPQMVKAIQGR